MRHKLDDAVYSQGWLEAQFESMLAIQTDEANKQVAEKIAENWKVVSEAFEDLVKENSELLKKLIKVMEAAK